MKVSSVSLIIPFPNVERIFLGHYRHQATTLKNEYLKKILQIRKIAKPYVEMASREKYSWSKILYYDQSKNCNCPLMLFELCMIPYHY